MWVLSLLRAELAPCVQEGRVVNGRGHQPNKQHWGHSNSANAIDTVLGLVRCVCLVLQSISEWIADIMVEERVRDRENARAMHARALSHLF